MQQRRFLDLTADVEEITTTEDNFLKENLKFARLEDNEIDLGPQVKTVQ